MSQRRAARVVTRCGFNTSKKTAEPELAEPEPQSFAARPSAVINIFGAIAGVLLACNMVLQIDGQVAAQDHQPTNAIYQRLQDKEESQARQLENMEKQNRELQLRIDRAG
ncbi:hypothetical protein HYH03_014624 [Edaphochlamys debaryana]|uniref:Uncharacterized protein n=1 Tax=Edaphochlamys debaryana TaxID=47281 RepID=A0A835XTN0_9CHLO|nr:hypothetical protein HYH03_014624 [Edaphochlamys debaryana]|eukprot:KAG2486695.1 hypothetical protein HYH03_014624 [Edaphochlamys debaryana]